MLQTRSAALTNQVSGSAPLRLHPQWLGQINGDQFRKPGRDEKRRYGLFDHLLRTPWCEAGPHISYWLIEMLRARGCAEAADEATRRVLALWLREPGFPENMRGDVHAYEAQQTQDYNWGIAMSYLLLTQR